MEDIDLAILKSESAKFRGQVLETTVILEWIMDSYIAFYFVDKKNESKVEEIITLILAPRVTYNAKCEIFAHIVDIKHPQFKVANPKYVKDLQNIAEHRNVFAHYPMQISEESIEKFKADGTIGYVKFKNVKLKNTKEVSLTNVIPYSIEEGQSIIDLAHYYSVEIEKILHV